MPNNNLPVDLSDDFVKPNVEFILNPPKYHIGQTVIYDIRSQNSNGSVFFQQKRNLLIVSIHAEITDELCVRYIYGIAATLDVDNRGAWNKPIDYIDERHIILAEHNDNKL